MFSCSLEAMKRKGEGKSEGEPKEKKPKKGSQGKAKSEKEETTLHSEKPHVHLAGEREGSGVVMCWLGHSLTTNHIQTT